MNILENVITLLPIILTGVIVFSYYILNKIDNREEKFKKLINIINNNQKLTIINKKLNIQEKKSQEKIQEYLDVQLFHTKVKKPEKQLQSYLQTY